MIYGGNKMFKFMLKIADFLVENDYIKVATEKKYMKERIEFGLEAMVMGLCIFLIWNGSIINYKNFQNFYLGMGLFIYDLLYYGFVMKYYVHKLNVLKEINSNIAKIIQRKISCIWGLTLIMACVYSINCDIRVYSFKCTMAIIICIIIAMVEMMRIETDLNNYIFK